MAAGDFTASTILNIKLKAEQIWGDSRMNADFQPNAQAAITLLSHQTAQLAPLQDPTKRNTVVVNWIKTCAIAVQDRTSNCDITGVQTETTSKSYAINLWKEVTFAVDENMGQTNIYSAQEVAARNMLTALKVLDEWVAQQVLIKLHSFAGANVAPLPGTYDNSTKITTIPAASYNYTMVPDLIKSAVLNRMNNPYFIEGGNLYSSYWNAQANAGNLDGKGDQIRATALDMTFDLWNFAASGVTESMFGLIPGAVFMANKTLNPDAPTYVPGGVQQWRYTAASRTLPGVKYDVYTKMTCTNDGNGEEHLITAYKVQFTGGIYLNPEGCPVTISVGGSPTAVTPTGVLAYAKGA